MTEIFTGFLDNIIFHQKESGFVILQLSCSAPGGELSYDFAEPVTAKGNMAKLPEKGAQYELKGQWVDDPKFGKQFTFYQYRTMEPENPEAIERYLIKACKGIIGKVIIKRIVNHCGKNTLKYLRERPTEVAKEIKGFSKTKAVNVKAVLVAAMEDEKTLLALESILGLPYIPKSLPMKAMNLWGNNAPVLLEKNPYLISQIPRIGFLMADKVALNIKFDRKSIFRKKAAIVHTLKESEKSGNTWINAAIAISRADELIGTDSSGGVDSLVNDSIIVMDEKNIALAATERKEQAIATWLIDSNGT